MKLKELKHNHSLTDLLKVLIFSILMITPLLSVATRCLYVICNKNAYQSYYGETINEESILNLTITELQSNNEYTLSYLNATSDTNQFSYYRLRCDYIKYNNEVVNNAQILVFYIRNDNAIQVYLTDTIGNTLQYYTDANINNISFLLVERYQTASGTNWLDNLTLFYKVIYNDYSFMDNVFEYSVNKLAQSPILSWTQQTAIYTGVNTMTTQLGVNTPTIPMLIVYWFLLTVIYIIIDIIIKLFTWLTHMIGSKSV